MVSYSQNFEDVILQRVFSEVQKGNYIDVGAASPIVDSNTYALYRKGWRGVAVEPLPRQERWRKDRPRDVFLNAAAGKCAGELTLRVFDQATQVSSGSPETIAHWERHNVRPSRSLVVPVLTLDSVIEEHIAPDPLHLIAIDVEGMEQAVLEGLDLSRHRPWVMVVEATVPGTPVSSHQAWEPGLLDSGYAMVYFDGVNRFYLAREHQGLQVRFALPPNIWDKFVTFKQLRLEAEVAQLKKELDRLRATKSGE